MVMVQRQSALSVSENIREGTPPGLKGPTRTDSISVDLVHVVLATVRESLLPCVVEIALGGRPEPALAETAQTFCFEVCAHQVEFIFRGKEPV